MNLTNKPELAASADVKALVDHSNALMSARGQIRKRSTLNEKTAGQILPFFEFVLKNQTDCLIPYSAFPMNSPNTVYKKVCDALVWLINWSDLPDERKNTFAKLRQALHIEQEEEGIRLVLRKGRFYSPPTKPIASVEWREILFEWIENPARSAVLSLKGLTLSENDHETIRTLISPLEDAACELTKNTMVITCLPKSD